MRKALLRKRHLSEELERGAGMSHVDVSGKGYPGRSNSRCEGPESHGHLERGEGRSSVRSERNQAGVGRPRVTFGSLSEVRRHCRLLRRGVT